MKGAIFLCISFTLISCVSAGWGTCRGIQCFWKSSNSYKTPSKTIHNWGTRTCGAGVSCTRAHGRVPSRCGSGAKLTAAEAELVCKKTANLPPLQETRVPVYLTGKADCKDQNDPNSWMRTQLKGTACCFNIPIPEYGVASRIC